MSIYPRVMDSSILLLRDHVGRYITRLLSLTIVPRVYLGTYGGRRKYGGHIFSIMYYCSPEYQSNNTENCFVS